MSRSLNGLVILSAAKDHLAGIERRKMILRCAQDDNLCKSHGMEQVHWKPEMTRSVDPSAVSC
jgi:hypothetical protein